MFLIEKPMLWSESLLLSGCTEINKFDNKKQTVMFFFFSKVLSFLLKPLIWVAVLMILGFLYKDRKSKRIFFVSAFVILIFFTNGYISNIILKAWELDPTPMAEIQRYDTGIVLTGVVNTEIRPHDRVYFQKGADRVTHAAQLYLEGKIQKIVISGGTGKLIERDDDIPEADNIVGFYTMIGIPWEDLIIDNHSQNTWQSAVNCKQILDKMYPEGRHLIVTSAFHQRRAMACFRKAGLPSDPFSCDFYTDRSGEFNFSSLFLPSTSALMRWEIMIKEWVGMVAYKVAGYI
jgi:uncharacterized SAM-binding protein YcdF (DUF218 family)